MPILEIVTGVAAIVSALNGCATLYRSWRSDKRREWLENAQNKKLERSLTIGGTTIQREYDTHFASLGRQFAVGDERARAELAAYVAYVNTLQDVIITLMNESNSSITLVLPSLPTMYKTSEYTRIGVVSTLAEQYQRMAQAKPLRSSRHLAAFTQTGIMARLRRIISDSTAVSKNYSTPKLSICEEYWLQECGSPDSYYGGENGNFECHGCGFFGSFQSKSDTLINRYNTSEPEPYYYSVQIDQFELFKSHSIDTKSGRSAERPLYCPICYDSSPISECVVRSGGYIIPQLIAHLKDTHTYDELEHRGLITNDYQIAR